MPASDADADRSQRTVIYTDGACSGNPGPGGWAWAIVDGDHASGSNPDTTNQRMELTAVLRALQAVEGPVTVFSDSTYVVNGFNERWYEGWLARNWRNANKKPVANRDLWEPLVEIFQQRERELEFVWVKAHSGDQMNDYVDALAVAEVERLREGEAGKNSGSGPAAAGPQPPWPIERAVAVAGAGHVDDDIVQALRSVVDGMDPGYDIVVSGLRRGAELAGAELALAAGVPLAVVLPFDNPAERWTAHDRRRFDASVAGAEWLVTLDGDPSRPGAAVSARNQWLWQAVIGVVVVADPGLTAQLEELGLGVIPVEAGN